MTRVLNGIKYKPNISLIPLNYFTEKFPNKIRKQKQISFIKTNLMPTLLEYILFIDQMLEVLAEESQKDISGFLTKALVLRRHRRGWVGH